MNCYKFLLIALPLAMILSCSSDDDSEFEQPEKKSYPIMMTATERPLADPDAPKGAPGRAPKVTTSTLDEFKVFWFDENSNTFERTGVLMIKDGNIWSGEESWPEYYAFDYPDKDLHFYAYNISGDVANMSPEGFGDKGDAAITVKIMEASEQQTDLLAGKNVVSYNKCNGVIPMTFDHISAAVKVNILKTKSLEGYTVDVREVVLHHIVNQGDYYFEQGEKGTWSLYNDKSEYYSSYTILAHKDGASTGDQNSEIEVETSPKQLNKDGDYLFLIPQKLTGWDKSSSLSNSYIEIKCKIYNKGSQPDANYQSVYLPLSAELKMGYINTLNISMGTALRDKDGNKIFQ